MRRVLSIDGGGILGIMPARFLAEHPQLYNDADLICGTSTGGLVALAIAAGLSPMQIVHLYRERGPAIFKKRRFLTWPLLRERYSEKPLEAALREVFGDKLLSSVTRPRILVTATDYNRERNEHALYFFDNESPYSFFDAARATSAAPTYFKPYIKADRAWVDGGLIVNSPADCALAETIAQWGASERIHIISIGCGIQPPDPPTRVTRAPWSFVDDIIKIGIGGGIGRVDTVLRNVAQGFGQWLKYDRYDFELSTSIAMDAAGPNVLAYLEARAVEKNGHVRLNGLPLTEAA